jgi:hypothetical protein
MRQHGKGKVIWLIWIAMTLMVAGVFGASLFMTKRAADHPLLAQVRSVFMPGKTTAGHYQIELACEACHTKSFTDRASIQQACVGCHGAALKEAEDKHPLSKFTDPRNAALIEEIDARECATCHVEHKPELTHAMGVTQPNDYCYHCHKDIAKDRPSHKGMPFTSCTNAGCHNFHDDRALYEDFLLKHANEPQDSATPELVFTNMREIAAQLPEYPSSRYPLTALTAAQSDALATVQITQTVMNDWLASTHANAGVNCSACHAGADQSKADWIAKPSQQVCSTCHQLEQKSFLLGKHGMRLAQGLSPMTPEQARLPMQASAAHTELTCTTCHGAHRFDIKQAAVTACLGCHNDEHTLAYQTSPHAELWRKEIAGEAAAGSGVSCATCHMPRVAYRYEDYDLKQVFVQHNQSDTLRPNEKMLRPVCMRCHGLGFATDALADTQLIQSNFNHAPSVHVLSIDMALKRDEESRRRLTQ